MRAFLRENWVWIVVPTALVLLLYAFNVLGPDDTSPFTHTFF